MRTNVLTKALLGVTLLLSMMLPSAAATINGWVDPSDNSFAGIAPSGSVPTGPGDPANLFNADFDYFSFTVTDAWVGALVKTDATNVTILGMQILSSNGSLIEQMSVNGKSATLAPTRLTAGDYYIGVMAIGGSLIATDGYSGTLNVSQVPLPPSVALFGTAVLGLGLAAGATARSKASQLWSAPIG